MCVDFSLRDGCAEVGEKWERNGGLCAEIGEKRREEGGKEGGLGVGNTRERGREGKLVWTVLFFNKIFIWSVYSVNPNMTSGKRSL